ncbi:hypothetical protein [Micromonospora sp. NPDC047730]|uniref:hypothetical protein n=1 Tax=Micromonospora sp. NPDC047730 TaxID=3364253 RepID=UPI0037123C15
MSNVNMGPSEKSRLFDAMKDYGLRLRRSRGNHLQVLRGDEVLCNLPGDTNGSDWRGWANALGELRRKSGFEWRPKQPRKRREPSMA